MLIAKAKQHLLLLTLSGATSAAAVAGCAVQRPPVNILGSFDVTKADDNVLFAALSPGRAGLYTLRTSTAATSAVLVRSDSGAFSNPCYLGQRIVYLYHRPAGSTIECCTLRGDSVRVLFSSTSFLTALAVAPAEDRFYFMAARSVGNSSPLAPTRARDMQLYFLVPGDTTARLASQLRTYTTWGKPQFDASGQHLLLELYFPREIGLSGPYALSLPQDGLRYLLPASLLNRRTRLRESLTGKTVRFDRLYQNFIQPVPARTGTGYFLVDYHQVVKVSPTDSTPQLFYKLLAGRDSQESQGEAYSIKGVAALHRSDSLLLYEEGLKTPRFTLLGPDGRRRTLPVPLPLPGR